MKKHSAFSLVELLIAMGILAVLATMTVAVFNPFEYARQSRDTRRVADLNALRDAMDTVRANNPIFMFGGATTTVYVSVPDPALTGNATSTCGGVSGMPTLPFGWSYQCVSVANLQKTDGMGWLPINFSAVPTGSPLAVIPIDPNNTAGNRHFYTYIPGGGMTAKLESNKTIAEAGSKDDGTDPTLYEIGANANPISLASSPIVSTSAASAIDQTTATLNGSANPNGDAATGWFRYSTTNPGSCNTTFGTQVGSAVLGSGGTVVVYSQPISGLTLNVTYYYCAIAGNGKGTGLGSVMSFTTVVNPPTIATNAASTITQTTVSLNSTINPNGANTDGWFRYATTDPGVCNDTFGIRFPATGTFVSSGTSSVAYSQGVTGLFAGTTHYYCGIGENAGGKRFGQISSFVTMNTPPTLAAIGPKSVVRLSTLTFTAIGNDADGHVLTYSLVGAPAGATINASTGVFSWTPNTTVGSPFSFSVQVSDGRVSVTTPVSVTVTPMACGTPTVTISTGNGSCPVYMHGYAHGTSFIIGCRYHSWDNRDNTATASCNDGTWALSGQTGWGYYGDPYVNCAKRWGLNNWGWGFEWGCQ